MIGSLSQQLFEAFFARQVEGSAPETGEETPPGEFLAALIAAAPEEPARQGLAPRDGEVAVGRRADGRIPGDAEELPGRFSTLSDGGASAERFASGLASLAADGDASNRLSRVELTAGQRVRPSGDSAQDPGTPRLPEQPSPESARPAPAPAGSFALEGAGARNPDTSSGVGRRAEPPTPDAPARAGVSEDLRRPALAGEGSRSPEAAAALPTPRELGTAPEPRRAHPENTRSAPREEATRARTEPDSSQKDPSGAGRVFGISGRTDPEVAPSGAPTLSGATVATTGRAPFANDAPAEALPAEGRSRVVQDIEWLASRGGGNARMRLHPPELGEIELSVRVRNNEVEVTIRTQDERAFRSVADSREMLIDGLATRELRTAQLNVTRWSGDDQVGRDTDPRQPGHSQDERTESERRGNDGSRQQGAPPSPEPRERAPLARTDETTSIARDATRQAIDVRI